LKKSFYELKGCTGKDWLTRFLNCYKNIISMTRAEGFNRAAVNGFFDILEAELQKHNCNRNRIFNVLETGLSIFQRKPPQVIVLKGKKYEVITSIEEKTLVIVIVCMSVARTCVPPMIIFPRVNFSNF
jgi:hypothetical protein